ncbi:MAG TPA: OmpA family protein [Gemmatimonadales bacterium]|jgi:outer membrane protein OmpA-like peptidoglycan-associated protein|nr:OmpA family protein [Gemmatimonadales bacterium]
MTLTLEAVTALALAVAMGSVVPPPMQAQFGKRLTQAVQSNAENRAIQKVVEHENKAIDAALATNLSSTDKSAGEGLYGSVKADGRVTATGVSFKEGTATLTDESAPALKAMGSMLQSHGDLKLRIEAYADDKAVAAARAQAVSDALVKAYGIDAGRLQAEGYKKAGEQRVELVQL